MRHFLSTEDWTREELQQMLDAARGFKRNPIGDHLKNKTMALVFFNPSLRTRVSFDVGAFHLGGRAVVLEPGKGAGGGSGGGSGGVWPIEFDEGVVMDGEAEEHIKEAARALSRYCDLIGVRAFPKFVNWREDRQDKVIQSFAKHATVPVINMETIVHPCQELALMLAVQENLAAGPHPNPLPKGEGAYPLDRKKFLLTWTYHPKGLNTAVANSALLIATKFGMDVRVLCPSEEYLLDDHFMESAKRQAAEQGGTLMVTHDIDEGYDGAHMVYAKSWGALPYFGRWEEEQRIRDRYTHFIVDEEKMSKTADAYFSHCLPMRRNVKATDAVVDSERSLIIEEAENRLHVQKAVMSRLITDVH